MVHRRTVEDEVLVFGNQGALWRNAMTWWDHSTGSIWSQPLGEALAGPRKGQRLELLASRFTSWRSWRDAHPDTLALDAPGDPTGFDLKDFYIVADFSVETRAYAISDVRKVGVVNDTVGDVELAVIVDPTDDDRWAVYGRTVEDAGERIVVELIVDGTAITDRISGSAFDPATGRALDGPLEGVTLPRLPALTSFPGGGPTKALIFDAFWPEGTVWRPEPSG